jgi:hypothetical protein
MEILVATLLVIMSSFAYSTESEWKMTTTLEDFGTRSQRLVTAIFYGERQLPQTLGTIITPLGTFTFDKNPGPLNRGWIVVQKNQQRTKYLGNEEILEKNSKKEGPFDDQLSTRWIYLVDEKSWLNPEKIDQYLKKKKV